MGRRQMYPHYNNCNMCNCELGGSKYRYTPVACADCKQKLREMRKQHSRDAKEQVAFLDDKYAGRILDNEDREWPAYVYEVRGPDGTTYYGSSSRPVDRMYKHLRDLTMGTHHNKRLQEAWSSTTGIGFTLSILSQHSDRSEAFAEEKRLLNADSLSVNILGKRAS